MLSLQNGCIISTKERLFFWHVKSTSWLHITATIGEKAFCINSWGVNLHWAMMMKTFLKPRPFDTQLYQNKNWRNTQYGWSSMTTHYWPKTLISNPFHFTITSHSTTTNLSPCLSYSCCRFMKLCRTAVVQSKINWYKYIIYYMLL